MLAKVCNQIVVPRPFKPTTASIALKKVVPVDSKEFRYLRFRAIGNMAKAGPNGNWDGFPYEHFEDTREGYGYRSFINKRAHYEHNCFFPGTLVLMADMSYKCIEDIKVGDMVISHLGPREVLNVFRRRHVGIAYTLYTKEMVGGVGVTGEHPVLSVYDREHSKSQESLVVEQGLSAKFRAVKDLHVGDFLVAYDYNLISAVDPEIGDLRVAKLLGLYLARGVVVENSTSVGGEALQFLQFSLDPAYVGLVDSINFIKDTAEKLQLGDVEFYFSKVNFYSDKFTKIAIKHCGRLSQYRVLSESIFQMSDAWKIAFLRSYFSTVVEEQQGGSFRALVQSKQLALQLQRLLFSLDISCEFGTTSFFTSRGGLSILSTDSYLELLFIFSKKQYNKLFGSLEGPSELFRISQGILTRIIALEKLEYDGYTYNLEVEEANTYVVNNILVHNSQLGTAGSIGDLPDAFLNKYIYPDELKNKSWADLLGSQFDNTRLAILNRVGQRDGDIEVLMRIDTKLLGSAQVDSHVQQQLARLIRMIDTGQKLTCSMGCLAPGAQVLQRDGAYKLIENVRRHDFVLTHRGTWGYVQDTTVRHYDGKMYEFKVFSLPMQNILTPEHPVWALKSTSCSNKHHKLLRSHIAKVVNNNEEYIQDNIEEQDTGIEPLQREELSWIEAKNLEAGDFVSYPITHEEIPVPHITSGKVRLIGYFLAKGSYLNYTDKQKKTYKSAAVFSFGNTPKDISFIEEVIRLCKQEWPKVEAKVYKARNYVNFKNKHKHIENFSGGIEIRLYKQYIVRFFEMYCGEYVNTRKLHQEVLTWPKYLQKQMLGAYFNGDGGEVNSGVAAVIVSETLAYQLSYILKRIKVPHDFEIGNFGYLPSTVYTLFVRNNWQQVLEEFWSYVYDSTTRYSSSCRVLDDYILLPISEVKEIDYKGPVYNLDVAGDDSFVAGGYITHNTNVQYSVCSACGNEAKFSSDYCEHLSQSRKGGITIVSMNDVRDLLTSGKLRPEWLLHLLGVKDVEDVLHGSSNRGVAIRNAEINHVLSFFELSVVGTPAYQAAYQLEKLARKQGESSQEYLQRMREELGENAVIDLYTFLQAEGAISTACQVS